jgi:iron complex transport system substrate-binding protein
MQVNSLASGAGSLVDEVLREAGFDNQAATAKLGPAGRMPLEMLIADPPEVIVRANAAQDFRTVLGDNLRHPAFKALESSRPSVHMPMNEWLCGTPRIVQAVERLATAREELHQRAEGPR